jgi:hypothetical protein
VQKPAPVRQPQRGKPADADKSRPAQQPPGIPAPTPAPTPPPPLRRLNPTRPRLRQK